MLRPAIFLILLSSQSWLALAAGEEFGQRTFEFALKEGDRVIVRNNAGHVRAIASDEPVIRFRTIVHLPEGTQEEAVEVVAWRTRGKKNRAVNLHTYFYANRGESVDIELQAPDHVPLTIRGIGPEVSLDGFKGPVRVETLRGPIEAANLSSRVSLVSKTGDLAFQAVSQPRNHVLLRTATGSIRTVLPRRVDLDLWLTGDRLFWQGRRVQGQGLFKKRLGQGSPRLVAESAAGEVAVLHKGGPLSSWSAPLPGRRRFQPGLLSAGEKGASGRASIAAGLPNPAAGAPSEAGRGSRFRVSVDWVHLNVSVRERARNRNITDLTLRDFQVLEDGTPQPIERFETTQAPFRLLLLLDTSGSTSRYLKMLKKATLGFTDQLSRDDRIAVAVFNTGTRLVQDFTNDRDLVKAAIKGLQSEGSTGFYQALDSCLTNTLKGVKGRKAVVVFTDGIDDTLQGSFGTAADITYRELFRHVQESDSLIYTIFLDTSKDYRDIFSFDILPEHVFQEARLQLQSIAEQSGGFFYSPRKVHELSPVYAQIARDLRHQYTLVFISNSNRDGAWRDLDVRIKSDPNLVARHRKGYFAPSR